jgi:hypothetical protein
VNTKLRVDQSDITLAELADVEEELGCSLGTQFERGQAKAIAALAWVTRRREDAGYTLGQALQLRMGDLDIVTPESAGEAPGGGNGQSPPESHVSGN